MQTDDTSLDVTLLKTFSLIGVIFLHATLPFTIPEGFWTIYAPWQSSLAEAFKFWGGLLIIPSFMLASGYLAALSEDRRPRKASKYIVNRIKRLLVPWFLLSVFWMVPLYTLFDIPAYNRPKGFTLGETYQASLLGLFADHLWFLLVLFWVASFWAVLQPLRRRFGLFFGIVCVFATSLLLHYYGQWLKMYCIWEIDGPLLWFTAGYVFFRYRICAEKAAAWHPLVLFIVNAVCFVALSRYSSRTPLIYWITSGLGALAAFHACLYFVRIHEWLRKFWMYRYFEENSFRFYLFHMPGGYLTFNILTSMGMTTPLLLILLSFSFNICLTAGIVTMVNAIEKRFKFISILSK
ncbi:MAG: acyltransferase [Deltaproteobacteria bacterium]|jgi:peptidoglycan/LPS O-acetylase OafA/YrhL|nr:acyltransferase [Deltaproteobacteria bacterium]